MLPLGIVIPTRNSMQRLPTHVEHVRRWCDLAEEIVVVDSHSADGTPEYLRSHLRHPRLQVLSHPPGLYESWNCGIRQIKSKYTYLSTIGDTITRGGIQDLCEAAERLDCDVVVSPPLFAGEDGCSIDNVRWPVHRILERLHLTQPQVLDRADAFIVAVFYAAVWGLAGILGSSASNVYRTATLQERPFPTDAGSAGDVIWGVKNLLDIKFAVSPYSCSTFLFHPPSYDPNTLEFNRGLVNRVYDTAEAAIRDCERLSPLSEGLEPLLVLRELLGLVRLCRLHRSQLKAFRRQRRPWIFRREAWEARRQRNLYERRVAETVRRLPAGWTMALWRDWDLDTWTRSGARRQGQAA